MQRLFGLPPCTAANRVVERLFTRRWCCGASAVLLAGAPPASADDNDDASAHGSRRGIAAATPGVAGAVTVISGWGGAVCGCLKRRCAGLLRCAGLRCSSASKRAKSRFTPGDSAMPAAPFRSAGEAGGGGGLLREENSPRIASELGPAELMFEEFSRLRGYSGQCVGERLNK